MSGPYQYSRSVAAALTTGGATQAETALVPMERNRRRHTAHNEQGVCAVNVTLTERPLHAYNTYRKPGLVGIV